MCRTGPWISRGPEQSSFGIVLFCFCRRRVVFHRAQLPPGRGGGRLDLLKFRMEVVSYPPSQTQARWFLKRRNHRHIVGCALSPSLSRPDVRRPSMRISYDSTLLCCLAGSPPHEAKPLACDDMREEEQKTLFSAGSISSSCFGARHRAVAKSLPGQFGVPGLPSQEWGYLARPRVLRPFWLDTHPE